MSQATLAAALEIDPDTLAKHFRYELTTGAAKHILEIREAIARKAKKGDVSAARLIAQWTAVPAVAPDALEVLSGAAPGIKSQRNAAAKVAQQGTQWEGILPATTGVQ